MFHASYIGKQNVVRNQTAHNHKKATKELLPPKLVDRLIYVAKNFPEIGWLEILPKEEGKEARETYIVYESLERAFQRIRAGEFPPDFPSDIKDRKKRQALKLAA